ncbi:hypothetical protein AVEN_164040-1 [Araneus ventricosus]|uniref:Uncharacterized protein n=1 Tax=Araneus ventricosus TaxID=182803 RepID=A0A4Y2KKB4_ARAVE|nr:hypothetical protein AVEN_155907-1 [Araneus ventricosus]GBN02017.1 hypothetical protein AVEN_167815-1 [Araneus ventricosus]GBN03726.1 hypothetical protein AVEN_47638-1 [Araneus ventricosus]GBN03753.1 hypothetical protein AVEN_164040-1 [Araneus ventricosus]
MEILVPLAPPRRRNSIPRRSTTSRRLVSVRSPTRREAINSAVLMRNTDLWRTDNNVPLRYHCGRPGHVLSETGPALKTACGKPGWMERCVLKVNLNETVKPFECLGFPQCSHQMILGWDFFRATNAIIDSGKEELQPAEILPDNITSGKSDFSFFAGSRLPN